MKQVVLITGVAKRLGLALAEHFLAQGFEVIGTYRTAYPSVETLRAQGADLYRVDFYQQAQLEDFIQQIMAKYTALTALIHNASDWLPDNESGETSASILHKMMTIHAGVPYQLNLAFKGLLEAQEDVTSDIIHISDYVAEKGSKKHIAYAASKAALNNMSQSFAALLAPNVKVNTISPAMIKFNEHDDDAYKAKALAKALIPVEAGFEELVRAMVFIMNSSYMTGRNLQLDGGRHLK